MGAFVAAIVGGGKDCVSRRVASASLGGQRFGGHTVRRRCPGPWREDMQINGACHCGRVSFTAQIDPTRVMICHCSDCQTLSGAPFRAVAVAPYDTLVLHGETKSYVKVAESGNKRAQVFCPHCATPLFATAPQNPTSVVIRLGCVAQRAQLVPAAQIWQRSALPWLRDLHDVPGSSGQQAFLLAAPPPP
jgi:hypothetical protein